MATTFDYMFVRKEIIERYRRKKLSHRKEDIFEEAPYDDEEEDHYIFINSFSGWKNNYDHLMFINDFESSEADHKYLTKEQNNFMEFLKEDEALNELTEEMIELTSNLYTVDMDELAEYLEKHILDCSDITSIEDGKKVSLEQHEFFEFIFLHSPLLLSVTVLERILWTHNNDNTKRFSKEERTIYYEEMYDMFYNIPFLSKEAFEFFTAGMMMMYYHLTLFVYPENRRNILDFIKFFVICEYMMGFYIRNKRIQRELFTFIQPEIQQLEYFDFDAIWETLKYSNTFQPKDTGGDDKQPGLNEVDKTETNNIFEALGTLRRDEINEEADENIGDKSSEAKGNEFQNRMTSLCFGEYNSQKMSNSTAQLLENFNNIPKKQEVNEELYVENRDVLSKEDVKLTEYEELIKEKDQEIREMQEYIDTRAYDLQYLQEVSIELEGEITRVENQFLEVHDKNKNINANNFKLSSGEISDQHAADYQNILNFQLEEKISSQEEGPQAEISNSRPQNIIKTKFDIEYPKFENSLARLLATEFTKIKIEDYDDFKQNYITLINGIREDHSELYNDSQLIEALELVDESFLKVEMCCAVLFGSRIEELEVESESGLNNIENEFFRPDEYLEEVDERGIKAMLDEELFDPEKFQESMLMSEQLSIQPGSGQNDTFQNGSFEFENFFNQYIENENEESNTTVMKNILRAVCINESFEYLGSELTELISEFKNIHSLYERQGMFVVGCGELDTLHEMLTNNKLDRTNIVNQIEFSKVQLAKIQEERLITEEFYKNQLEEMQLEHENEVEKTVSDLNSIHAGEIKNIEQSLNKFKAKEVYYEEKMEDIKEEYMVDQNESERHIASLEKKLEEIRDEEIRTKNENANIVKDISDAIVDYFNKKNEFAAEKPENEYKLNQVQSKIQELLLENESREYREGIKSEINNVKESYILVEESVTHKEVALQSDGLAVFIDSLEKLIKSSKEDDNIKEIISDILISTDTRNQLSGTGVCAKLPAIISLILQKVESQGREFYDKKIEELKPDVENDKIKYLDTQEEHYKEELLEQIERGNRQIEELNEKEKQIQEKYNNSEKSLKELGLDFEQNQQSYEETLQTLKSQYEENLESNNEEIENEKEIINHLETLLMKNSDENQNKLTKMSEELMEMEDYLVKVKNENELEVEELQQELQKTVQQKNFSQNEIKMLEYLYNFEQICKNHVVENQMIIKDVETNFNSTAEGLSNQTAALVVNISELTKILRSGLEVHEVEFSNLELFEKDMINTNIFVYDVGEYNDGLSMEQETEWERIGHILNDSNFADSSNMDELQYKLKILKILYKLDAYFQRHRDGVMNLGESQIGIEEVGVKIQDIENFHISIIKLHDSLVEERLELADRFRQFEQNKQDYHDLTHKIRVLETEVDEKGWEVRDEYEEMQKEIELLEIENDKYIDMAQETIEKYIDEYEQVSERTFNGAEYTETSIQVLNLKHNFDRLFNEEVKPASTEVFNILEMFSKTIQNAPKEYQDLYRNQIDMDVEKFQKHEAQQKIVMNEIEEKLDLVTSERNELYHKYNESLADSKDVYTTSKKRVDKELSEYEQKVEELRDMTIAFNTSNDQLIEKEKLLNNQRNIIDELKLQIEENKKAENESQLTVSQLSEKQKELLELQKKLHDEEEESLKYEEELSESKNERKREKIDFQGELKILEGKVDSLNQNFEEQEKLLLQKEYEIETKQAEILESEAAHQQLTLEKQSLEEKIQIQQLKSENDAKERLSNEMNLQSQINRLSQVEESEEELANKNELLESELSETKSEMQKLGSDSDILKSELQKKSEQLSEEIMLNNDEMLKDAERVKDSREELERNIQIMESLEIEKSRYVSEIEFLEQTVYKLGSSEKILNDELENEKYQNEKYYEEIEKQLTENFKLTENISKFDELMSSEQSAIENLSANLTDLSTVNKMQENIINKVSYTAELAESEEIPTYQAEASQSIEENKENIMQNKEQVEILLKENVLYSRTHPLYDRTFEEHSEDPNISNGYEIEAMNEVVEFALGDIYKLDQKMSENTAYFFDFKDDQIQNERVPETIKIQEIVHLSDEIFQLYRNMYSFTEISIFIAHLTANSENQEMLLNLWSDNPSEYIENFHASLEKLTQTLSLFDEDLKNEKNPDPYSIINSILVNLRTADTSQFLQISQAVTGLQLFFDTSNQLIDFKSLEREAVSGVTNNVSNIDNKMQGEESEEAALFDILANNPPESYNQTRAIKNYEISHQINRGHFTTDGTTGELREFQTFIEPQMRDSGRGMAKIKNFIEEMKPDDLYDLFASVIMKAEMFQSDNIAFNSRMARFESEPLVQSGGKRYLSGSQIGEEEYHDALTGEEEKEQDIEYDWSDEAYIERESVSAKRFKERGEEIIDSRTMIAEELFVGLEEEQEAIDSNKKIQITPVNELSEIELDKYYRDFMLCQILRNPFLDKFYEKLHLDDESEVLKNLGLPANIMTDVEEIDKMDNLRLSPSAQLQINSKTLSNGFMREFSSFRKFFEIYFNFFIVSYSSNYIKFKTDTNSSDNSISLKFENYTDTINSFFATTEAVIKSVKTVEQSEKELTSAILEGVEKINHNVSKGKELFHQNISTSFDSSWLGETPGNYNKDREAYDERDIFQQQMNSQYLQGSVMLAPNPTFCINYRIIESNDGKVIEAEFGSKNLDNENRPLFVYDYHRFIDLFRENPIKLKYIMATIYHSDILKLLETPLSEEYEARTLTDILAHLWSREISRDEKEYEELVNIFSEGFTPLGFEIDQNLTLEHFIKNHVKTMSPALSNILTDLRERKLDRLFILKNNNEIPSHREYVPLFNMFNAFEDHPIKEEYEIPEGETDSNPFVLTVHLEMEIQTYTKLGIFLKEILEDAEMRELNSVTETNTQILTKNSLTDTPGEMKSSLAFSSWNHNFQQLTPEEPFNLEKLIMLTSGRFWYAVVSTLILSALKFYDDYQVQLDKYWSQAGGEYEGSENPKNRENTMYYEEFKTIIDNLFQHQDEEFVYIYQKYFASFPPQESLIIFINFLFKRKITLQHPRIAPQFNGLTNVLSAFLKNLQKKIGTVSQNFVMSLEDIWNGIRSAELFSDNMPYNPLFFFEIISLVESNQDKVERNNIFEILNKGLKDPLKDLIIVDNVANSGFLDNNKAVYYNKSEASQQVNKEFNSLLKKMLKNKEEPIMKWELNNSETPNPISAIHVSREITTDEEVLQSKRQSHDKYLEKMVKKEEFEETADVNYSALEQDQTPDIKSETIKKIVRKVGREDYVELSAKGFLTSNDKGVRKLIRKPVYEMKNNDELDEEDD